MHKKIFNKSIATSLIQSGHSLIGLEQNRKHPNLVVFVFENTRQLDTDLSTIIKSKVEN